ncbi:IPT/TIG domain-containing protein [Pelotalea chapellei]|uniref:IPT/TIG domain-containing protein n=1 Tax=Pelotalea chapellei TaxID=44671 RepID=A0ABS5UBI2_9BACT|nr:IPT/TIG domain-containing protein [Pelotalea chapellei]MBT1073046.1 hypothetical protein [Pelotalea chapellei]
MKKNVVMYVVAAIAIMLGAATVLLAQTPPPVPQTFGLYDAKFTSFTKTECLGCHVSDEVLVVRHHNLINTKNKACLDCHTLISDPTGGFTFDDFRTCNKCHSTSPHHTTAAAIARNCQLCHGSTIDNPLDGHTIPTYAVTSVTPKINGRPVVDPTTGAIVTVQGCVACHQPNATAIDPKTNTVRAISSNADTHHGTNIGHPETGGVGLCTWCHNFDQPGLAIRQCESCHGIKSLHNIQPKVGTVIPGAETAGLGHIGANWDCQGCHWSWFGNADQNPAKATVPSIGGQSSHVVAANKAATLTLTGSAFTNVGGDSVTYNPTVTISNSTTSITLTPTSFTDSEIQVIIPALLEGNYDLNVVKGSGIVEVKSNLAKLSVVPQLAIKSIILASKNVTISGSGFGSIPPADYKSGLGVFAGTTQARIVSWAPTKIVAAFQSIKAGNQVTVKTLNGAVSAAVLDAGKKSR